MIKIVRIIIIALLVSTTTLYAQDVLRVPMGQRSRRAPNSSIQALKQKAAILEEGKRVDIHNAHSEKYFVRKVDPSEFDKYAKFFEQLKDAEERYIKATHTDYTYGPPMFNYMALQIAIKNVLALFIINDEEGSLVGGGIVTKEIDIPGIGSVFEGGYAIGRHHKGSGLGSELRKLMFTWMALNGHEKYLFAVSSSNSPSFRSLNKVTETLGIRKIKHERGYILELTNILGTDDSVPRVGDQLPDPRHDI